jgi:hypothetical protein
MAKRYFLLMELELTNVTRDGKVDMGIPVDVVSEIREQFPGAKCRLDIRDEAMKGGRPVGSKNRPRVQVPEVTEVVN